MTDTQPKTPSRPWRFYHRVSETWDAMYRDCREAKKSIELEQYIFENDSVGQRFMELFIEKAKQGLKVFLICDRFGSALLAGSPLVRKLRRHGGHVHFYNPFKGVRLFMPWRWLPRNHTKTLLIDSSVAYIGGVCLAERMRHWRDTHMRVTGEVIGQIRQAFDDIENRILRKKSRGISPAQRGRHFLYFLNRPNEKLCGVYEELSRAADQARRYIYISSAYFIPDRRFLDRLQRAHGRGVDVRILVPARSDLLLADLVCLSYTPRFLAAGLRLFHYRETVLHSKTAIIDDDWGTVGSANFDVLSFFHNREANIVTTDADAVAELKAQFFADLQHSAELTREDWRRVPPWKKLLGLAGRGLRVFL